MKKNKGMKIYKQKKRKRKNSNQVVSVIGTCSVLFILSMFGYYAVGKPFYKLMESMKKDNNSVSLEDQSSSDYSKIDIDNISEEKVTAVTEVSKETVTVKQTVSTSKTTEKPVTKATTKAVTTTATTIPDFEGKGGCYYLQVSEFSDPSVLEERLKTVDGFSCVVLPLKVTGGTLYYNSNVESARNAGVIASGASISDLVSVINKAGLVPVAEISTIADNIYPRTYKKSAYQFDDGVTGEWLDNKYENGGKPWTSPFSDLTIEYLSNIVDEITSAGVKAVICTDTYFPPFREKDLGYIGAIVQGPDRYKGLSSLINTLDSRAKNNHAQLLLSVSYNDMVNKTAEVLTDPSEFGNMSLMISVNAGDIDTAGADELYANMKSCAGNMKPVPCILSEGMSAENITSAVRAFESAGCDFYVVK